MLVELLVVEICIYLAEQDSFIGELLLFVVDGCLPEDGPDSLELRCVVGRFMDEEQLVADRPSEDSLHVALL